MKDQVKGLNLEMASAAEQLSATTRDISKSNAAESDQSQALATAAEEMSVSVMLVERDSTAGLQVSETAQQTASNKKHKNTQTKKTKQNNTNNKQHTKTTKQNHKDKTKKNHKNNNNIDNIAILSFLLAL